MAGMVFFTARPSFLTIQFSQQHIVGLDLSVDLTVVSDDPFSFQRPFCHAHMDGGLLIQPSGGVAADYGDASKIGVYEGNNTTTVTLTVTGTESAAVANAALAIKKGNGNPVGYVNNANGTYTFVLGRGETASVEVSATGYKTATVSITAAYTAAATYAATQALSAPAEPAKSSTK